MHQLLRTFYSKAAQLFGYRYAAFINVCLGSEFCIIEN